MQRTEKKQWNLNNWTTILHFYDEIVLYFPTAITSIMSYLVGRCVLLLGWRGFVLGWTAETHTHSCLMSNNNIKHVSWADGTIFKARTGGKPWFFTERARSKPRSVGQNGTYSPFSLLLRCLRYIAIAVPITASSKMTPMMPPMILPVAGPFSGRRWPERTEKGRGKGCYCERWKSN